MLKDLIGKKTQAIYDYEYYLALQEIPIKEWMEKPNPLGCREDYLKKIHSLICSSQLNSVKNLDRFSKRHLINGTTQSFDESYLRYSDRRLRLFRGEYAYHKRVNEDFCFIEDEPLEENDFVIISLPFCTTGDRHPEMDRVLNKSLELGIPVEIDCAYFGTCLDIEFDFSHPSIKAVSFSLSKGLGLGDVRSGIRYSDYDDNFPIAQQNNYNHTVNFAAKIGLFMMERFDFDHIPRKYRESQLSVCKELGLIPTKCMHLALGSKEDYEDFNIDGIYYRVGLREAVKARFQKKV